MTSQPWSPPKAQRRAKTVKAKRQKTTKAIARSAADAPSNGAEQPKEFTLSKMHATSLRGSLREVFETNERLKVLLEERETIVEEILTTLGFTKKHRLEPVDLVKGVIRVHEPVPKKDEDEKSDEGPKIKQPKGSAKNQPDDPKRTDDLPEE